MHGPDEDLTDLRIEVELNHAADRRIDRVWCKFESAVLVGDVDDLNSD